ncbi:hypothetical protein CBS63078_4938 [Aspergillus niger]|uniref:Protein kinase domain-containing protein n=2 Tax=Aspergillus niger TaxID=5061 RepID=G3YFE6_ASPNA|nr:kinase-like protein [Aspergillus niger CBS 101883]EHA18456.1 hypothetical protein ASPNIDRAFT_37941 [Aspergillus niger ATCC 1015]KAI2822498.1 hypothetical protein CBS115989_2209 [Aspergillus niger]KAI2831880.1 hypothetical protein CBS133816_2130 [Aspergillus niger]KAI2851877.1 hypothetical protein CBS11350_1084 [Aspergillus niger]KAI2856291.1 hypothetical protein CBS11232_3917 [Aspergillus niger]|eukprot:XP_001393104.2 hypothetical protein ANI_1_2400074 [Aspergillus niger CBS 513.88]
MGALQFPPGIDPDDMIGQGSSGIAALDPKTKHIIKFPFNEDEARAACDREKEIYERLERSPLPRPSSLLKYYGPRDQGILLEYAKHGTLRRYAYGLDLPIPLPAILRWAKQAAEALQFIHENGIAHGDVSCVSFYVDQFLDVKVGDFTRSSDATPQAVKQDISDYGSALYYLVTGQYPYQGLPEKEVEECFKRGEFPDLTDVQLKSIIHPCWAGHYNSFEGLLVDVQGHVCLCHRH